MSARIAAARQMAFLMRDTRGRFTRVRAALAEIVTQVRARRPRRGVRVVAEQLALFSNWGSAGRVVQRPCDKGRGRAADLPTCGLRDQGYCTRLR